MALSMKGSPKKQHLKMDIKAISEEGTFEGILSPYGNIDAGSDVVEKGAYTKTLRDRGNVVPLLWQHKPDCPIGELMLEDKADGLYCKGKLLMALPEAQKAYLLIKSKIVKGLSIGFETIKDSIEGGIRKLKEIKLYEGSIVTFPMNEMALISSVKKRDEKQDGDFNEELTEIQTWDAMYQMFRALQNAIWNVTVSGLTKDEMVSAGSEVIKQFSEAFNEFFPNFCNLLEQEQSMWSKTDLERKAGASISASNADKIRAACDKIMAGHNDMMALLEDKAGAQATTLPLEAAIEKKTEPAPDHSAAPVPSEAEVMIESLRKLIPA